MTAVLKYINPLIYLAWTIGGGALCGVFALVHEITILQKRVAALERALYDREEDGRTA